jgi:hypothetical protein
VNDWRQELRSKPALRLGLLAIIGLAWIYGLLELEAAGAAARREQAVLIDELARLQGLGSEAEWRRQRDEVYARVTELRGRAWREESEGRMQALLQDWLRQQLSAQGLQARELTVAVLPLSPKDEGSDLRLLRARLAFDFDPDRLHALIGALYQGPAAVWMPRLLVTNAGRRSVEMDLEFLFILGLPGAR